MKFSQYFPILEWGKTYGPRTLMNDSLAALIVTIMLIPQSLAYALLAGLPPVVGLYASILPLIAYAIFGTGRTLAVGPVAVISIMTAAAAGNMAVQGSAEYLAIVGLLALLSGAMLLILGLVKAGFIADFLSHPVISGFITASGILIAISQLKHIFGVSSHGHNIIEIAGSLWANLADYNLPTLIMGMCALIFLFTARAGLSKGFQALGIPKPIAQISGRLAPVIAVATAIAVTAYYGLDQKGVKIVGEIPKGLPPLTLPEWDLALWRNLLMVSFVIAVIGFVESVSVAQTLAAKRRQSIDANQELIGLGAANIAAAFSGGFPVTGGFSRSAVNFDAGAETPAAGIFTAIGILIAVLFLTPVLYFLPNAVLAATIIVAVLTLVNLKAIQHAWAYSKSDFFALIGTIIMTLLVGIEAGVLTGLALSVFLYLYRTSRPHYAIVGQVQGTEHFRNIDRHEVEVHPTILSLRIDESLYFANAHRMEKEIYRLAMSDSEIRHVILMCSAINHIDFSALESLQRLNGRLRDAGVKLHLSELKGPVADRLALTDFLEKLTGNIYLSQYQAVEDILNDS